MIRYSTTMVLVWLAMLWNVKKTFAQEAIPTETISTETISRLDGLASSNARNIIQDLYGLLWLATGSGIQNFNGKTFKNFRNDVQNLLSFKDNDRWGLLEGRDHNIWVGNGLGISNSRGGNGHKEPTDLNVLVREFTNLAFHRMRASKNPINVKLDFDLDKNVGQINLIADDFSRVVLNLCNNAFDAMREKANSKSLKNGEQEYHPTLTVETRREGKSVILAFSDNGLGIPDEIRNKILQPFFTTKKGTDGTGLGLSITNDIVMAHGGDLKIDSDIGAGTRFTINLSTL